MKIIIFLFVCLLPALTFAEINPEGDVKVVTKQSGKGKVYSIVVPRSTCQYQLTAIENNNVLQAVIWEKKFYEVNEKEIKKGVFKGVKKVVCTLEEEIPKAWIAVLNIDEGDLSDAKEDIKKFLDLVENKRKTKH